MHYAGERDWGRRRFLAAAGVASLWLRPAAGMASADIEQPDSATPQAFAARALAMRERANASGDQPYGAVVVQAGRIIGEAPSRVHVSSDPTAHAEMEAIRDAARRSGAASLRGAVMYGSSPACPMCEAAAYWAGIGALRHGADAAGGMKPQLRSC